MLFRSVWILERSTDLVRGEFTEVYRIQGPEELEILQQNIEASFPTPVAPTSVTVEDTTQGLDTAYYRIRTELVIP